MTEEEGIWHCDKQPNDNYVRREKEHTRLDELRSRWLNNNEYKYVIVTGLGGVGKTELAINFSREFCNKREEYSSASNCIWINAETNDSQLDSFQSLAKEFEVPVVDDKERQKSLDLLIKELYPMLFQKRSLLVLDNIETYDDPLFKILNELAKKPDRKIIHPFVMITSRLNTPKEFFGSKAEHIQLDNLPWRSVIEFCKKSFNLSQDDSCLWDLCKRLDSLPLALNIAVAAINNELQHKSTVAHEVECYLKEYEKLNPSKLDARLPILQNPISTSVYQTWLVTLNRIKETELLGDLVEDILKVVPFLSSFDIKISLLKQVLKVFPNNNENEHKDVEGAIKLLADFSMCSLNRKENTISVHRVVQDVLRAYLQIDSNDYLTLLDHLLTIVSDESFINHETVTLSQLAHLRSLWNHASEYPELVQKHFSLPPLIAGKYILYSRYEECLSFITDEVEGLFEKQFGNESENTLFILYWKACALEKVAEYPESRKILLKCLEIQTNVLGENHDHTLRSSQMIASTFWHEGKFDEAMEWFEKTLPGRTTNFDDDHEQTLVLKGNMALALIDKGEHQQGLDIMEKLLDIKKGKFGLLHLETLITKHNVAWAYFCLGDYNKAKEILTETIEEKRNSPQIGPNHADTTDSMHLLVKTLIQMEKYEEANKLAHQTLKLREIIFGPNHPKTNNTRELIQD